MLTLMFWNVENAVHIGEPMSSSGLYSRISRRAFSRLSRRVKSHGWPSSGSFTVMSNARPGARYLYRPRLSSVVMRGGE